MKITSLRQEPAAEFPYHCAGTRRDPWGNPSVWRWTLPVLRGSVDSLPEGLDALLLASDLQGTVRQNGKTLLLGEVLPEFLEALLLLEMNLQPEKTGVILCGDLFAIEQRRGGLGDVRQVWRAFRERFRWVAGVSGNHDDIGQNWNGLATFRRELGIFYLENGAAEVDGLHLAGLSGVIGEGGRFNRLPENEYAQKLEALLKKRAHLTLTHQNPFHPDAPHKGGKAVLELLSRHPGTLLACGHAIWKEPLLLLDHGTQVLNLAERVVVLTPKADAS